MTQQPLIDQSNNQVEFSGGIRSRENKSIMKASRNFSNDMKNRITRILHNKKEGDQTVQQLRRSIDPNYQTRFITNTPLEPKLQPLTQWMYYSMVDPSQEFIEWYNTKMQYVKTDPIFVFLEEYQLKLLQQYYTSFNNGSCITFKYFSCLDHQFFNENGLDKEYYDKFVKYLNIPGPIREYQEWYLKLYALSQMIVEQHVSMGGVDAVSAVYQNQYIIYMDPELEIGKTCLVCNKCGVKIVNPIDGFVKYLENVYCGEHTGPISSPHDINCGNLCYQMVGVGIKPTPYFQTQPRIEAYTIIGLGDPTELMNLSIQVMPDYSLLAKCLKLKNNYSQADITGSVKSASKALSLDKRLTQNQNSQIQLYGGVRNIDDLNSVFVKMRKIELCEQLECLSGNYSICNDPQFNNWNVIDLTDKLQEQYKNNVKMSLRCQITLQQQLQINIVNNDINVNNVLELSREIINAYTNINDGIVIKSSLPLDDQVVQQNGQQNVPQNNTPRYFMGQFLKNISQLNLFKNYLDIYNAQNFNVQNGDQNNQRIQIASTILNAVLRYIIRTGFRIRDEVRNNGLNDYIISQRILSQDRLTIDQNGNINQNNIQNIWFPLGIDARGNMEYSILCRDMKFSQNNNSQYIFNVEIEHHNMGKTELNYTYKLKITNVQKQHQNRWANVDEQLQNCIHGLSETIYLHASQQQADGQGDLYKIDRVYLQHGSFYIDINGNNRQQNITFFGTDMNNNFQRKLYSFIIVGRDHTYHYEQQLKKDYEDRIREQEINNQDEQNINDEYRRNYIYQYNQLEYQDFYSTYIYFDQLQQLCINMWLNELDYDMLLNFNTDERQRQLIKAYIQTMDMIYQRIKNRLIDENNRIVVGINAFILNPQIVHCMMTIIKQIVLILVLICKPDILKHTYAKQPFYNTLEEKVKQIKELLQYNDDQQMNKLLEEITHVIGWKYQDENYVLDNNNETQHIFEFINKMIDVFVEFYQQPQPQQQQ